jgi:hypothetical protein
MERRQADRAAAPTEWWSVVQAIAWLVERSDAAIERTAALHLLRALRFVVPALRARSFDGRPPVSLDAAPIELLAAVRRRRLVLRGRERGVGPQAPVPMLPDWRLQDRRNAVCVGGDDVYREGGFWSDLWLSADACRACWPGAPAPPPAVKQPERRAGRKPQKIEAAVDWLRQNYPSGIPPAVKNEVLLQDLAKDGIEVSDKTLRRALTELKVKSV